MPTTPLPEATHAVTFSPPVADAPLLHDEPHIVPPHETARRDAWYWATAAVLAAGIVLRLWAWWTRGTMWMDEIAIARNVQERTLAQLLFLPLDYMQAAPKGFLLLEWGVTRALGDSAIIFRLVPLAASLWSLWLFRDVARRLLTPAGALVALLFFAVVVLAGLGLALAATVPAALGLRAGLRRLAPLGLAWALAAGMGTWVALGAMSPATADYMRWFHAANMPPEPLVWAKLPTWLFTRMRDSISPWHGL